MSADNYLGIFKMSDGSFQGHSVWAEDEDPRSNIDQRFAKFIAETLEEAVIKAENEINNFDSRYEYGIRFFI
jgi:hypothetical protein